MAITAVSPNQVVPALAVREPVLSINAPREQTLATPPSAITRISSEGRLRAELERKQILAAATNAELEQETTVSRPNSVPRRTANEAAADAAIASAAQRPVAPARLAGNVAAAEPSTVTPARENRSAAQTVRFTPPAQVEAPPPELSEVVRRSPRDAINPVSIASRLVENVAVNTADATGARVIPVQISQTANEFVAAFNEFQNKRNQALENVATANQARAANQTELRVLAPTERSLDPVLENRGRSTVVGRAPFDSSTFAVGVARNRETQRQTQNSAPSLGRLDDSNDTRRIVQAELVHGVANQTPVPVQQSALSVATNPTQTQPSTASQRIQTAQQNSAAGTGLEQSGLAKHLNDLANLLTP